ncbi:putative flavin-containing monooxygenase 1 [Glycine soja]
MVRSGISKFIESYLLWKLPLDKYGLKPEHPFEEDYASCQMAISIKLVLLEWRIEFEDNSKLEADVVVLATGFDGKKKLKSILPHPLRSLGTVYPLIPSMAFVGYIENVSNLATSEIRSCGSLDL